MLRGLFIGAFFFTMTPLLISIQWLLDKLNLPGWGFIAVNYYRVLCRLLRIRVRVIGEPVADRAVLFVSNHVSWVDILVIGSVRPVAFVAKREVASLAAGRRHRAAAAHGVRRPHAPPADRRRPSPRSSSGSPAAPRSCCLRKAPRATAIACCRSARRWSAR